MVSKTKSYWKGLQKKGRHWKGSKRWEVWIRPPSFLVNTGPIWSVKEEGCLQQQKSKTLELRGKKGRGHKEVAWRMAAVAGSVQDTQATQLQLLVLHQLYKPYISGEFALLFIKWLEWNTQTEKTCIFLSFMFSTVLNETHRKLSYSSLSLSHGANVINAFVPSDNCWTPQRGREIEIDQNVVIIAVARVDKLTCFEPPEICNTLLESYQRSINQ